MTSPLTLMNDEQALKKLEDLKRNWSALRERQIRCKADIERLSQEESDAGADAVARFGTSDLDELRAQVVGVRTNVATTLDEFSQIIEKAQAALEALNEAPRHPSR